MKLCFMVCTLSKEINPFHSRDEEAVKKAVTETANTFGGIDICINNASAISLTGTAETPMKR